MRIALPLPLKTNIDSGILFVAGMFMLVSNISLTLLNPDDIVSYWLTFVIWCISAIIGQVVLIQRLPKRDVLLFPSVMFLSGWGIIAIDRLAPRFADRQIIWLAISVAAMLFVAVSPNILRWLRNYRYLWLFAGLLLLISTIIFGSNPSGSVNAPQLWLGAGNIFFQPSELLKLILVVFVASYLAEQYPLLRTPHATAMPRYHPRIIGPILLMWGLAIIVLVWQRDLGTAILFFLVFLALLYVASGNIFIPVAGFILTIIAGAIAYQAFSVVQLRVDIWINPWADADGDAFQIVQSLHALAAGGIFGQGVGQGSPLIIPVVHSDFVYAAIVEEWGLFGAIIIIGSFAILTTRGLQIGIQQNHPFRALLGIGLSVLIAVQSIIIMGGVIRLLPLTGITLPFLSYGGSSLLMSFIIIGLLLRLSNDLD